MVEPGVTTTEPGVATPPMPGSMLAEVALVTPPQLKVVELPAVIVEGEAVKDGILGVPEQAGGGPGLGTTMTTVMFVPKKTPFGARICHEPV